MWSRSLSVLVFAVFATAAAAQSDQTTGNLVYTSCNPAPTGATFAWTGFSNVTSTGGNTTNDNGAVTGYNVNNCTFYFGYNQGTVAYTYAINQALAAAGTGIQVRGYNWSWEINNLNYDNRQGSVDTLTARVLTYAADNVTLRRTDTWLYDTKFDWTTFSGTVNYANPGSPSEFGNMRLEFTGRDTGFWAGYYGPQVRNISLSLNFGVDQCAADPLSSPDCAGYQQALFTQQCTANPLYDSACPGYATAYHDQQCSINALHATTCPGYTQAYFDQQCTANPLYNNQCPGYAQAYFDQQCNNDPFYSQQCPGYAQAYYDQQCSLNPLYDRGCPNYAIVARATTPPAPEAAAESVVTEAAAPVTVAATDTSAADPVTSATATTASTATTSTTSPTSVSPAAVVSVVNPPAAPAAPAPSAKSAEREAAKTEARANEKKAEENKTQRAVARLLPRATAGSESAVSAAAAERAAEAAADSASATTIEAQQAAQNLVMGLMGFNPAFAAYQNAIVPDVNAAVMARQYNRPTVDNRRALRALSGASDRLHQDMVDQQYGRIYQ